MTPQTPKISALVHARAKTAATRDLIWTFRAQYDLLHQGWVEHYRRELDWADRRPEANRRRGRGAAQSSGDTGAWTQNDDG